MSRRPYSPLEVHCSPEGRPRELCWQQRTFWKVEKVLDRWMDTGCWWEGESEKMFYRLYCREGKLYEIFQDLESKQWFLYKVYD